MVKEIIYTCPCTYRRKVARTILYYKIATQNWKSNITVSRLLLCNLMKKKRKHFSAQVKLFQKNIFFVGLKHLDRIYGTIYLEPILQKTTSNMLELHCLFNIPSVLLLLLDVASLIHKVDNTFNRMLCITGLFSILDQLSWSMNLLEGSSLNYVVALD